MVLSLAAEDRKHIGTIKTKCDNNSLCTQTHAWSVRRSREGGGKKYLGPFNNGPGYIVDLRENRTNINLTKNVIQQFSGDTTTANAAEYEQENPNKTLTWSLSVASGGFSSHRDRLTFTIVATML